MHRALFLFAACGLAGACGGGAELRSDDFDDELERAFCEWAVRCGGMPDMASCRESGAPPFDRDRMETILSGVRAGTVEFDGDRAEACIAVIDELGCTLADVDELNRAETLETACEAVFTGTVSAGGACAINEECVSGECLQVSCMEACCSGICETATSPDPPVTIGGECASTSDCVAGAYCEQDAGPLTCQPLVGEDGPCDSGDACQYGLFCVTDGVTAPRCLAAAAEGESCAETICGGLDQYCASPDLICSPLPRPGESCAAGPSVCVDYAECIGGVCVERGLTGDACGGGAPSCLGELACSTGVCAAPVVPPPCIIGG